MTTQPGSHKVIYTDKAGKPASLTFPTHALASAYARTVRNARIESSDAAVAPVEVTRCPEGTAEAQQAATRAYYAPIVEARAGAIVAEYEEGPPENEAELMGEHFADARAAGQSQEDAWADWDYAQGRSGR